jgi:Flp pilus assembly protein TadD
MLNPDDPEIHSYRGEVYASLGMNEKAVADFKAVLALNPTDIIAYGNLAWLSENGMIL